jgi:hypothetical protein
MVDGHIQYDEVWITSAQCFSNLIDCVSMTVIRVMGSYTLFQTKVMCRFISRLFNLSCHTPWLSPSITEFYLPLIT